MSIINVTCIDQTLTIVNSPTIASGGVEENYIEFTFDSVWSGFAKTAVFFMDEKKPYYSVIDANNRCVIPWETTQKDGKLWFGVVGVSGDIRLTTELKKYNIVKGGYIEEAAPSAPTEDVWAQCLEQIEKAIKTAESASGIPYIVTITSSQEGGYTTNHTAEEINIAFLEGRTVYAKVDGVVVYPLAATSISKAVFRNLEHGYTLTIQESAVSINLSAFYTHATHPAMESGFYKITVDNEGHISKAEKVEKEDITKLGIPGEIPEALKPTAHVDTHKTGGADALKPGDIGAAAVGTNGKVVPAESSSDQVTETNSRSLTLADAGCDIVVNSTAAVTITVPSDDEVDFPIDTEIIIFRAGTGTVTINFDSVTVWSVETARGIADQYTSVLLKKRDADTWSFEGNIG